jgi:hypothetical protein
MQVGQTFGHKNGHIAPKQKRRTIATSNDVDASLPKFRPKKAAHRTTREE